MLRTIALLAGVFFLPPILPAQVATWLSQSTSPGYDQVSDVAIDDQGNTYLYGQAEGNGNTFTIGTFSQTINSGQAAFVIKLDPAGSMQWVKLFETNWVRPWDIAYGGGQLYVTGNYSGFLDIGPFTLNSLGSNAFLVRLDTTGFVSWGNNMSPAYEGNGLVADSQGNAILVGHHYQSLPIGPGCGVLPATGLSQRYSTFIAKYDLSNNCVWTSNVLPIQNPGKFSYFNRPTDVAVDSAGNVYVVGEFVADFQFAGNTFSNPDDSSDTYILKYSATGIEEWAVVSSGIGHFFGTAIEAGPNQTITVGGNFSTGGTIGNVTLSKSSGSNGYLLQLDGATGNTIGSVYLGPTTVKINDIDADEQGNLFVTGEFYKTTLDVGNGVIGTLPNNNQGGYVAAYDDQLTAEWVKVWGDCCSASGYGLELDPTENRLLVGGYYFGDMTLDGIQLISTGQNEAFVANIQLSQPIDSVWPGDANDDLVANNFDLLQVGLAYNNSGPPRANASTAWIAQPADLWGSSIQGIDLVHADTDGSGLIDAADTLAISLNYGLTHNKNNGTSGMGPVLATRFLQDSLNAGDTAIVVVELGTAMDPAMNIYGVAFSLLFDSTLVDPSSAKMSYSMSWLGLYGQNMLKLDKLFSADGQMDVGLVRTDQLSSSGYGEICRMSIIMVDDLTGKDLITEAFTVQISNGKVIDVIGEDQGYIPESDTVIVVQDISNSIDSDLSRFIQISPNPAEDFVRVKVHELRAENWSLRSLHGQEVLHGHPAAGDFQIDLTMIPSGSYFLIIETNQGRAMRRLIHR